MNNLPVARLPNGLTKSNTFQRVFGNFIFEVQPDTSTSFSAVQKYNGCCYEFSCVETESEAEMEIIIIEKIDGVEKELIPHTVFQNQMPHLLIENYSHFWNKTDNSIEFRPKLFSDINFSKIEGIEYRLDLNERILKEMKTQRPLLDINSNSYMNIMKQLSRLESSKFIHVLMDGPRKAQIELMRMRLKFVVDCSARENASHFDMTSSEFSGMRVSRTQKCGTLFGLNSGLLLESMPYDQSSNGNVSAKILIIPHGEVNVERTSTHVSVHINIESKLRSPAFHVYQVDEFCCQLKANNSSYSAWFYLAYLHALTSHGEVRNCQRLNIAKQLIPF